MGKKIVIVTIVSAILLYALYIIVGLLFFAYSDWEHTDNIWNDSVSGHKVSVDYVAGCATDHNYLLVYLDGHQLTQIKVSDYVSISTIEIQDSLYIKFDSPFFNWTDTLEVDMLTIPY